ncbi:hypothetical protein CCYA_CCYA16G4130 [Cyanidiococcus yangmingshanensis]|nr:hypothetical protein CCYA_CCYA16G4130 [Cyanidiococcus yangmingshanensis]
MNANKFGRSERFGKECSLLVVDVQNDFADKAGALYVTGGEQIVPLINEIRFAFQTVVFTKDWHPPGHISFASAHAGKRPFESLCADSSNVARTLWPEHCVQNTWGAELHPELIVRYDIDIIFEKATKVDKDSYSAFRDEAGEETELREILKKRGVSNVYVCGLAFDYCVGCTALDAVKAGFEVFLIENATMPISKEGRQQMMQRLHDNGVHMITYARSE